MLEGLPHLFRSLPHIHGMRERTMALYVLKATVSAVSPF